MTLDEKLGQLYGVWVGASDDGYADVAPHQHDLNDDVDLDAILPAGLGHVTRPFGTAPVDAAVGALSLVRMQERIVGPTGSHPGRRARRVPRGLRRVGRHGVPRAAVMGRDVRPALVERMARRIGADMRSSVHQGLAPVLDVVRDARWGRVEETIGEDPYPGHGGDGVRARARVIRDRLDAQALRRLLGVEGRAQLAPVSVGSASSPTCCCRRSRWPCARAAPAAS